MPPDDSTPLGDAMTRRFPQQKIPEPEPGSAQAREREQATDISRRPGLPDHPRPAAGVDEEDDAKRSNTLTNPDAGKPGGQQ